MSDELPTTEGPAMSDVEWVRGRLVVLRPAAPEDRRMIFDWLYRSDVMPAVCGPPLYPDRHIPPPAGSGEGLRSPLSRRLGAEARPAAT
jgi:hypothetical protein